MDGNTDVKTFDEKYIMFKNVKKVEKIVKKTFKNVIKTFIIFQGK